MRNKIKWNNGEGYITATYKGSGNGSASIMSDINTSIDREQIVKIETEDGSVSHGLTVLQRGLRETFSPSDGLFVLADGGTFNVLKIDSPDVPIVTYTRLTYIECTGEQYLNLNYVVEDDDIIDMYYIVTSSSNSDKALFGSIGGNGYLWFSLYYNTAYVRYGGDDSVSINNARQRYYVKVEKGSISIDDITEDIPYNNMPTTPLYLFARCQEDLSADMFGYCQTSGFRITKKTGELVMDLKPCKRDSDGAIGMLDVVSGIFYTNKGTGADFICGSEFKLPIGYEEIDYTTFNKDKLFDLGIINNKNSLDVMFKRSESVTTPYLYGIVTRPHTASVTAYLSSGGSWRFGSSYKGVNMNNTRIHNVKVSDGNIEYDFTDGAFSKSTFTTPNTVVLGGSRSASGALSMSYQGRVYYFRIYKEDEVVLDWKPCVNPEGVEGFWDCVSQTFVSPI